MVNPDNKPKPSQPSSTAGKRPYDYLIDRVPVPDAVESDSDTVWGLWELSQQDPETPGAQSATEDDAPTGFADTIPFALEADAQHMQGPPPDFDNTIPTGLDELLPPLKKSP